MQKTTHDGPLTGVHWPIHRGRGSGARVGLSTCAGSTHREVRQGTKTVVYITARGLGSVIDGSVWPRDFSRIMAMDRFSSTTLPHILHVCVYTYIHLITNAKHTHDSTLTGVHWPIHRGWCRGSGMYVCIHVYIRYKGHHNSDPLREARMCIQ